jgi:serine/threonine-protein kinase
VSEQATTRPTGTVLASAADFDTMAHDGEEAESVRVYGADDALSTVRSGTVPAQAPDRFEEQAEIGRGGMGSVHRVYDRALLRTVAEKRLRDAVRVLPGAEARFLEEVQITGQLDHPNIVPVHDIVVDAGGRVTSFRMKLVRGRTLKELISQSHADGLSGQRIEELLQIYLKLCDAVAFAHSRGVIHRDLKPDNVMVGSHGQVYLMDWGIARLRAGSRPSDLVTDASALGGRGPLPRGRTRSVVGTPAYMAPEQAEGRVDDIDDRTDVFGLGAILYRILTDRAPHAAETSEQAIEKAIRGSIDPPEQIVPGVRLPPGLCQIAMKALARAPDRRFESVDDLKRAVVEFQRGGGWFRTLHLRAGTVIVREGEEPETAYLIKRGRCEAYRVVAGQKQSLRIMNAGETFGEASIFADQPRAASVVALDDVELVEITLGALERELEERPWMRAFITALAERFLEVNRELGRLRAAPEK